MGLRSSPALRYQPLVSTLVSVQNEVVGAALTVGYILHITTFRRVMRYGNYLRACVRVVYDCYAKRACRQRNSDERSESSGAPTLKYYLIIPVNHSLPA